MKKISLLLAASALFFAACNNNKPKDTLTIPSEDGKEAVTIDLNQMKDAAAGEQYRKLADDGLQMQRGARDLSQPSPNLEDDFKAELADAAKWYDDLRAKEIAWIQGGNDVEAEFDRLYTESPRVANVEKSDPRTLVNRIRRISWPRTIGLAVGVVGLVAAVVAYRRREKPAS